MSRAEVERLVHDLKDNAELLADIREGAGGVGSVVALARAHGYDINVAEAKDYIQSQTPSQLSDAQIDVIAGGKGAASVVATAVEATNTVTTEAHVAETTQVAVAEEVVVAVAVIVAT